MTKSDKALGQKLKEFRLMRGMNQTKAAIFFGVSMATYVRIEHGKGCGDLNRSKIEKTLEQQNQAA
jgi:DNA-binding XRE family transcriptional regulator